MGTALCQESTSRQLGQLPGDQLERLGVRRLNKFDLFLECMLCKTTWSPRLKRDGALPRGYWLCANRCNW